MSFTFKDYLNEYKYCWNCNDSYTHCFFIFEQYKGTKTIEFSNSSNIELILSTLYFSELTLNIECKTNKIKITNMFLFNKYIKDKTLKILTKCVKCNFFSETSYLYFDLAKMVILPFEIMMQSFSIKDKDFYEVVTHLDHGTRIYIHHASTDMIKSKSTVLDMPVIFSSKFKHKQHFIEMVQMYNLLS